MKCVKSTLLVFTKASLLDSLATRVLVPIALQNQLGKPLIYLNPVFIIIKKVTMLTSELAGMSIKILGDKVTSLRDH